MPNQPAREALRAATADAHEALDRALSERPIGDVASYGRFLLMHAEALPTLEAALVRGGFGRACPGWAATRRTDALLADLAGLGLPVPRPRSAPPARGARAWGVAYVIEGARLGGRVLERRARAGGEPSVLANARFLSHRDALPWPRFVAALEAALPTARDIDAAAGGAAEAFGMYSRSADVALARPVPPPVPVRIEREQGVRQGG
jgi:heme oxygenase